MKQVLNSVGNVEDSNAKTGYWVGIRWEWMLVLEKGDWSRGTNGMQ